MAERKKLRNTLKYDLLDKEISIMCRIAKENWLQTRCTAIMEMSMYHKTKDMNREIKQITKQEKSYKRKRMY